MRRIVLRAVPGVVWVLSGFSGRREIGAAIIHKMQVHMLINLCDPVRLVGSAGLVFGDLRIALRTDFLRSVRPQKNLRFLEF